MKKLKIWSLGLLIIIALNVRATIVQGESDGFDTPEEALCFFAEALAAQDYGQALEAFPISRASEKADFSAYLNTMGVMNFNPHVYVPNISKANMELNYHVMEQYVVDDITNFVVNLFLPENYRDGANVNTYTNAEDDLRDFDVGNLEGFSFLAAVAEGEVSNQLAQAFGADSIEQWRAAFQIHYQNYVAEIQLIRYENRYYLWDLMSVCSELGETLTYGEDGLNIWDSWEGEEWMKSMQQVSGDYEILVNADETVTIADYHGDETQLIIPETLDSKKVTAIASFAFNENEKISSVTFPSGVVSVGAMAFANCSQLTNVSLPEKLKQVGAAAFFRCPISEVQLPASLQKMGVYAFQSVKAFSVTEGNTAFKTVDGVLFNQDGSILLQYPLESQVSEYTIPEGVKEIRTCAFVGALWLSEVNMPAGLEVIGDFAFGNCEGLNRIELPESVTRIGKAVFSNCTQLESVNIPSSVTRIEDHTFSLCQSLGRLTIPEGVTRIGNYAFEASNIEEVVVPKSVTSIGEGAFDSFYVDVLLLVQPDSYVVDWAEKNGINYVLYTNQ